MSKDSWNSTSRIVTGGTAFSISGESNDGVFLASPAGLFRGNGKSWSLVARGFPFLQTSATLTINGVVFVSGLPEGMVRSYDGGKNWDKCWAEQIQSPIVCFAVSPRFSHDGMIFAGTQNDGVLRSVDGGKHWALSNFGLRNFSIFALATTSDWTRREVMFAATENGVYRSPNGGRAWKIAGLEGQVVQALAVSPNFSEDKTVFAGTESKGLYRSKDGGETWHKLKSFESEAVNTLCYFEKYLLAGTSDEYILRSSDDGDSWAHSAKTSSALCIACVGDGVYAGVEEGVLFSDDGKKWSQVDVAAYRFDWLVMPAPDVFVAGGVSSGVWVSADGVRWNQMMKGEMIAPLLNIAASREVILAAKPNQLVRSIDLGATWDAVLDRSVSAIVFADDKTAWVGGDNGELWLSVDRARTWQMIQTPFDSLPIVGVAATSPETLMVGVADHASRRVLFYRSHDAGAHWKLTHDQASHWFSPRIGNEAIGLGTTLAQLKVDGWTRNEVTDDDAPINSILALDGECLVGTAAGVMIVERNKAKEFNEGIDGVPIVALQQSPNYSKDHKVFALSADGMLYERRVA